MQRLGFIQKPRFKPETCKSRRCSRVPSNFGGLSTSSCKLPQPRAPSRSLSWESLDLDLSGLSELCDNSVSIKHLRCTSPDSTFPREGSCRSNDVKTLCCVLCGHFINGAARSSSRSEKRSRSTVPFRPQPSCSECRGSPLVVPKSNSAVSQNKRARVSPASQEPVRDNKTVVARAGGNFANQSIRDPSSAALTTGSSFTRAFHPPDRQATVWPDRSIAQPEVPTTAVQPRAPLDMAIPGSSTASREAAACLEASRTFEDLAKAANAHRETFLLSHLRPSALSDDFFPRAISMVLEPSASVSEPAQPDVFDWSGMPPLPPADASEFRELHAHALGPGPHLKYGASSMIRHVVNAVAGRVDCAKGLKTSRASRSQEENDRAEAQVLCLRQASTVREYLEVIKARTLQVQGGARRAASMLSQAFYFSIWSQHCSNLSRSPFRWIWALGARMSPEHRAAEEGLIITFLAYASIRWQSFGVISQCMSHIFLYHERYMLVPRLEKSIGILGTWMRDFESRMVSEEISCHGRDALLPAQLGELINRELSALMLPPLSAFVSHPREQFDLVLRESEDLSASKYCFQKREAGSKPLLIARDVIHSIVCAAAMATCSKGCYRGGNLAVGDDFQPSAPGGGSWTRQQALAIAGMVTSGQRIAIHKPRTKTSFNKSAESRRRARVPQAFEHAPEDPLDLPSLFFIMCWLDPIEESKWQFTPAFRGVKPASKISISADELNSWLQSTAKRHHPALAKLLHLTQYSARIGMATVLALVASPEELDLFGAWASKIGRTVYARMTAERSLQIQRDSMCIQDVTLESLVGSVQAAQSRGEVIALASSPGGIPTASAIQPLYAPVPPSVEVNMYDEWATGDTVEAVVQEDVAPPAQVRAEAVHRAQARASSSRSSASRLSPPTKGRSRGRPPTPGSDAHFRQMKPPSNKIDGFLSQN